MPAANAWDCPCGIRNAATLARCHNCGRRDIEGRPVYIANARPPAVTPKLRRDPITQWFLLLASLFVVLCLYGYQQSKRDEAMRDRQLQAQRAAQQQAEADARRAEIESLKAQIREQGGDPDAYLRSRGFDPVTGNRLPGAVPNADEEGGPSDYSSGTDAGRAHSNGYGRSYGARRRRRH